MTHIEALNRPSLSLDRACWSILRDISRPPSKDFKTSMKIANCQMKYTQCCNSENFMDLYQSGKWMSWLEYTVYSQPPLLKYFFRADAGGCSCKEWVISVGEAEFLKDLFSLLLLFSVCLPLEKLPCSILFSPP